MPADWRTVRVFISSTFRDMHAERDWLVKRVFPALRERLEKHRVHLIDIDLRWGITEQQASNDQVLDLCLDQIDECRPFFLGLLGERYGWVPEELPGEASRHGWTQSHTGKSVTELEIRWGVLLRPEMRDHALFCFRDRSFDADVPEAKRSDVLAEDDASAEKLARLKDEIRAADLPIPVVEDYPCRYAGLRINWGLARFDLDEADQQSLERVAADGLVDNAEYAQLDDRLKEIVHQYGVVSLDGLEEFGRRVLESLWNAISAELDLAAAPSEEAPDELTEERGYHERFMESRLRVYVGRQALLDELTEFAEGDGEQPCLVTGPSGSGKSAAMAKFADVYAARRSDATVISHFIGASPASTSLRQTLHRLCSELKAACGFEDDVPPDTNSLITTFRQFVTQVPEDRRAILIVDALNQLDESENAHQLYWLPWQFPPHVKLIASCIDDPDREEAVLKAFEHRQKRHVPVRPLTNEERFAIVEQVPSLSAKSLDPRQVQQLLENPATTNPLYLLVALEELRGFGSFEQLGRRIELFPRDGDTVTALFTQVIERLEDEFENETVQSVLSLLACARRGLSDRELLDLIEGTGVAVDDSTSDLFPIVRQLRPYLQHRGELWDFFHRNLYKAVHARYLEDDEAQSAVHARLAEYFQGQDYFMEPLEEQRARARRLPPTPRPANIRKVDELPFQVLQVAKLSGRDNPESPHWDAVADLFTDLHFLEAKAEAQPYARPEDAATTGDAE
ncbi:MAG: DUF4062 domain-containing protein [Planctomycetota bacterium]|nr:MAG: DUF4062 domain-containing protein [Planctomycetota bacterium]